MARIAGVNIPTGKRVPIALQYIHGIGPLNAEQICEAVGIDRARRVNELSDAEVLQIREYIDANLTVEGDLRRETQMNIKRMMDLGSYRGLRHRRGRAVPRGAERRLRDARQALARCRDLRADLRQADSGLIQHVRGNCQ